MIHNRPMELEELSVPLGLAEEPETFDLLFLVVAIDGLPLLLEVGQVLLHPIVVYNLAP